MRRLQNPHKEKNKIKNQDPVQEASFLSLFGNPQSLSINSLPLMKINDTLMINDWAFVVGCAAIAPPCTGRVGAPQEE